MSAELRELLAAKERALCTYAADPSSHNWRALYDPVEAVKNAAVDALPGLLDEVESTRSENERLQAELAALRAEVTVLKGSLEGLSAANAHHSARCEKLEAVLLQIRDSTFRDAASLRAIADNAINRDKAGDFVAAQEKQS